MLLGIPPQSPLNSPGWAELCVFALLSIGTGYKSLNELSSVFGPGRLRGRRINYRPVAWIRTPSYTCGLVFRIDRFRVTFCFFRGQVGENCRPDSNSLLHLVASFVLVGPEAPRFYTRGFRFFKPVQLCNSPFCNHPCQPHPPSASTE